MTTREQWLNELAQKMSPWFKELGHTLPPFRVSIGFPSTGKRGKRIGECWYTESSTDQHHEIFISPVLVDDCRIAGVLAHELVHTIAGPTAKHGHDFKVIALAIGLEGKMTSTTEGELFKSRFAEISKEVGPYPGAGLILGTSSGPPKQTTRLRKCECEHCGYIVRVTRKWIDDVGAPICPVENHGQMKESE